MDKLGVDKEEKGPNKNRLWAKVAKEYNGITGNAHTKARLNKKWQNIKHQRKLKRQKLFEYDPDGEHTQEGNFYHNRMIDFRGKSLLEFWVTTYLPD